MVGSIIDAGDRVHRPGLHPRPASRSPRFYKDWAAIGGGLSAERAWRYGDFPETGKRHRQALLIPRGVILNGNLNEGPPTIDLGDPSRSRSS